MLTITFSDEAYETFHEALRWPVEKEYRGTVTLGNSVGSQEPIEVQFCGYSTLQEAILDGAEGQIGIRYRRAVEIDGVTYIEELHQVAFTWHDAKPYLKAVHIY